ncbi:TPR_REGION domain-containing protein [Haematococcus lacustris]|uniref:TPR_REGION domain-containing protein n=1 Tax=Haematococcus lacustris TaxID=44745 RepID=A0A699ZU89_HAELA|nr:TPR_REGION domain-containing protein [Haematococcus lacustris]
MVGETGDEGSSSQASQEEEELPSYEFRFECAKLLLELDESTETAVEVLQSLVEEDDTNPDVWQLLSLALYSGHQYEEALEAIVRGQSLMRRMRVPKADPHWAGFEELAGAVKDAMGQEAAALGEAGIKGTA